MTNYRDIIVRPLVTEKSIRTQAMFPMLTVTDADRDCASFLLMNKPKELLAAEDKVIGENKLIVRTRADKFAEITEERYELAMKSKANIVSTDYPPRTDNTDESYVVSFNGKTVRKIG